MKKAKAKIPGQSWSIKEKLDVVNAFCSDPRLSHGEVRAAVVMVLYFHNTQSGELFPSREQVSEQACIGRDTVIGATRKMRRLGYLHYEDSDGGCNHRNTYFLRKQTVGCSDGKPSGQSTPRVEPVDSRVSGQSTRNYPCKDTSCEEIPSASPSPCDGKASASVEKEEEAGKVIPFDSTPPPEKPFVVSEEEKARRLAIVAEMKRNRGGRSAC